MIEKIGEIEMLLQTAEEASELAQACLKMARKISGKNPTPKPMKEIKDNLEEEIADVLICIGELGKGGVYNTAAAYAWITAKENRIKERFGKNNSPK